MQTPKLAIALLVSLIDVPLHAANVNFLNGMPIAHFTQEDTELMRQSIDVVLESADPKATEEWSNPKTGNSGSASLRSQFVATDGATCKRLVVTNSSPEGKVKNSTRQVLCRYEGRGWVLHPDAVPAASSSK